MYSLLLFSYVLKFLARKKVKSTVIFSKIKWTAQNWWVFSYFNIKFLIYFIILHNKFRISRLIYTQHTYTPETVPMAQTFWFPRLRKIILVHRSLIHFYGSEIYDTPKNIYEQNIEKNFLYYSFFQQVWHWLSYIRTKKIFWNPKVF